MGAPASGPHPRPDCNKRSTGPSARNLNRRRTKKKINFGAATTLISETLGLLRPVSLRPNAAFCCERSNKIAVNGVARSATQLHSVPPCVRLQQRSFGGRLRCRVFCRAALPIGFAAPATARHNTWPCRPSVHGAGRTRFRPLLRTCSTAARADRYRTKTVMKKNRNDENHSSV